MTDHYTGHPDAELLMTDEQRLRRQILENPADDGLRLIYADVIQDHGDDERAEFIRVQIEYARIIVRPLVSVLADPRRGGDLNPVLVTGHLGLGADVKPGELVDWDAEYVHRESCRWTGTGFVERIEQNAYGLTVSIRPRMGARDDASRKRQNALRWRERELFAANKCRWFGGSWAILYLGSESEDADGQYPDANKAFISRGFVSEVRLTAAAFMGGPCDRCETYLRQTRPSLGVFNSPEWLCAECKGTGTLPGLARRLFSEHPIERVVLTDKRPAVDADGCFWFDDRRNMATPWIECQHYLPAAIYDLLDWKFDLYLRGPSATSLKTEKDAMDVLSDACVSYGRQLAGLPPLSNEVRT